MSKRFSVSGLILLALILAGSLAAQQNPPAPGQEPPRRGMGGEPPVGGTITSVGVDRFEIKKDDGTSQIVMVNDQTRFRERQQQLQLEDLKVGDHVFVRGQMNADKQWVAGGVMRGTGEQFQRGPGGTGGTDGPGGGQWGPNAGNRAGGEILSIDQNQIKVRGRQGERTIVINDQTKFMKEGHAISPKDLKVGDRIFAFGKDVDGKFVATDVRSGRMGMGMGQGRGGVPPQ